jgi:hypothetical protein
LGRGLLGEDRCTVLDGFLSVDGVVNICFGNDGRVCDKVTEGLFLPFTSGLLTERIERNPKYLCSRRVDSNGLPLHVHIEKLIFKGIR